jgi:hypothetical protein
VSGAIYRELLWLLETIAIALRGTPAALRRRGDNTTWVARESEYNPILRAKLLHLMMP